MYNWAETIKETFQFTSDNQFGDFSQMAEEFNNSQELSLILKED